VTSPKLFNAANESVIHSARCINRYDESHHCGVST